MQGFIWAAPECLAILNDSIWWPRGEIVGSLSKRGRRRQRWEAIKIFRHNPCVFSGHTFALVALFVFVSVFAKLQVLSACLPKRKDRR